MPDPVCEKCGSRSNDLRQGMCATCESIHAATLAPDRSAAHSESAAKPVEPGRLFGEYELLEEVARGGMGVIYKARHTKLNRIAALKMILSGRFSSKEELQRFHVEAEAAARLDHPGIVPVFEIGEFDGQAFFAMKFIEGGSLADRIQQIRGDTTAAMKMLRMVVQAVSHAHQRGILHRDLKPANILIDENDHPMVTDLGLAKTVGDESNLTNTGAVLGTPSYMPPEQAAGNIAVTTAADVYSLGAIMYELLTGEPPFRGKTALETVMQVRDGELEHPRRKCPGVDRDLELICLKCLEKSPDDRYESALALSHDLDSWLAGDAISIRPPSMTAQVQRWFQKNRRLAYLGFALLMGILITMPFALTFVSGGDFSEVYDHFPDEQRPWLFSLGNIPNWLNLTMGLSLPLLFWPGLGFLNALVGRPKGILSAIGIGMLTSIMLIAVFSVLLGWMPLLRTTNSEVPVTALAKVAWSKEGSEREKAVESLEEIYPGIGQVPENIRARVIADRIQSDRLALAPSALTIIFLFQCVILMPVVYGTVLGYVLLQRGHRLWVCYLRYTLAWWLIGISILIILNMLGGISAGRNKTVSDITPESIGLGVCVLLCWLIAKRWRKSIREDPSVQAVSSSV